MINARPGYWDVDRCSWVGTDLSQVVPPVRPAEHTHDGVVGAVADAAAAADLPEPRPVPTTEEHPVVNG